MKMTDLMRMTGLLALSLFFSNAWASSGQATSCPAILNHKLTTLQEEPVNLCQYAGQVVLFVNTASYCGNTSQYGALEKLYAELKPRGFVILGFPANDFGEQEPGSNGEIAKFCKLTYGVKFPMMEKSHVIGKEVNPVYKQLVASSNNAPEWNFHKYLLGRDGKKLLSFPANLSPDAPEFRAAIETLLKAESK